MKMVNWARFSWNLTNFAAVCPAVAPSYSIRRATPDDQDTVKSVVLSSFTLDSDWNPFFAEIRTLLEAALTTVFHEKHEPLCLIVAHGARIIGASALAIEPEAQNHLLTGPCVSMEYRNRGLASALLTQSLLTLRDAGLPIARGVTKQGSPAAQFIYPKLGSVCAPPETKSQ